MQSQAKFTPTGHRRPVHRPREYEQGEGTLASVFVQWMHEFRDLKIADKDGGLKEGNRKIYSDIYDLVKNIDYTIDEANALALYEEFKDSRNLSSFITACYDASGEKIFVFDLDAPELHSLGHGLGEDIVLVNKGTLGAFPGSGSYGVVLNYGTCGNTGLTNGLTIDVGESEINAGVLVWNAEDIINFGYGRGYTMRAIPKEDYQDYPELVAYIEDLRDNLKDAITIKTEVRDVLKECGWDV